MKKYSIESQQNTKRLFAHNISKKSADSNFVFDQPKTKKSKSLINLILFFLVISLVIIIYFFFQWIINYDKTATLDYYLAPSTATVIINEKPLKSDGKIKLKPGIYTIKVSQPGFTEISKNIELKVNQTTYFYEYLEPDSSNQDYYKNHSAEESRTQHISDFKADLERKSYTESDPIFKVTPYSSYKSGFSITAEKQSQTSKILLKINLLTCSDQQIEALKSAALKYLKDNQINPENYDIQVTNC